jgi:hypothetical protein
MEHSLHLMAKHFVQSITPHFSTRGLPWESTQKMMPPQVMTMMEAWVTEARVTMVRAMTMTTKVSIMVIRLGK